MKIRDYEEKDFEDIKRIHALKEIDYELPDLQQPLFIVKKVLEVEGKMVMALGAYIQVETYLWLDPGAWAKPQEKLDLLNELQHEFLKDLWMQGVECAVCYVPEHIEKHFGKRLTKLGWSPNRGNWRTWGRSTQ